MNKDYIDIYKKDGTTEKMEVVATFDIEKYKSHYIIYKSIEDKNKYYAASYTGDIKNSYLNTNLTDEEKKDILEIFNSLNESRLNND